MISDLLQESMLFAFRSCNVPIFSSDGEADVAIAVHCRKYNRFGVLSNDSDFHLMDIPAYIPLKSLEVHSNQAWGTIYNPIKLADLLKIPKKVLLCHFFDIEG